MIRYLCNAKDKLQIPLTGRNQYTCQNRKHRNYPDKVRIPEVAIVRMNFNTSSLIII
jgi:hypothetical protein